jgi:hypothetical protein
MCLAEACREADQSVVADAFTNNLLLVFAPLWPSRISLDKISATSTAFAGRKVPGRPELGGTLMIFLLGVSCRGAFKDGLKY